jgi:hypothetical protein
MSDTWIPEENTRGPTSGSATVPAAPADGWVEEQPKGWGEWLTSGAGNVARVAASNIPLWDRARALPDVISGKKTYDQAVNDEAAITAASRRELGPFMASTSDIAGGVGTGLGAARAGLTTIGRNIAAPLWQRIATSAAEAGLWGGIQAANQTYSGNLPDYITNAGKGAGAGMVLGAALPAAGAGLGKLYNTVSDRFSGIPVPVLRAGAADTAGLQNLNRLGPDAMLADAGPSMQATAQAAVQGMGDNRTRIVNAMLARDRETVPRLQADREAAIGPAPRVSQVENAIDRDRQAINANDYAPVLQGRSIHPQGANTVMTALDSLGQSTRVPMNEVRNALTLPGTQNLPDLSPQTWLQARQNVDSMIAVANRAGDRYRVGVLGQARDLIDNELAANVPGIKAADAKFAGNRAELEALQTGQTLLDKGKNAVHPDDLRDVLRVAPPVVGIRLRQGAHADLERKLGTQANDLTELERTIGTPQDWNAQKLRTVFGDQPAQAISDSVARNRQFRETQQKVTQGSDTAQRLAAREDTKLSPTKLGSRTLFGTVLEAGGKAIDAVRDVSQQQMRDRIARLMALRDPAEVAAARDAILAQNANTARRGPLVSKYSRAGIQGGFGSVLSPIIVDEEQ